MRIASIHPNFPIVPTVVADRIPPTTPTVNATYTTVAANAVVKNDVSHPTAARAIH